MTRLSFPSQIKDETLFFPHLLFLSFSFDYHLYNKLAGAIPFSIRLQHITLNTRISFPWKIHMFISSECISQF